jgi:thiamine biosynthesis lipoprotein
MYRESRVVMDTLCTITVVSTTKQAAGQAVEAGFKRIEELEKLLNYYDPESEISAINRASGRSPVKVSSDTLDIVQKAVEIAGKTGGAFDPTIGPLMKLWGFTKEGGEFIIPPHGEMLDALKLVDYRKVRVDRSASAVFLEEEGMELDLGGIAKGYAADKALQVIQAQGIKAALVAIAGDIKGFGERPDHKPWRVGVQNPRPAENESDHKRDDIFASLYLHNEAVSTSGDYQRFFITSGKRYHHILDPGTGFPASELISVSVVTPEGYLADALSTGIFILGREKGIKLLYSLGYSGIIVDRRKSIFITDNLKGKVDIEKDI